VRDRFREGLRASLPYAVASLLLSFSFGAVAVAAGLSPLAAVVMSAIVYAGSAQFASIGILAAAAGWAQPSRPPR
jgi:predicted branched-subunit amino acid permease